MSPAFTCSTRRAVSTTVPFLTPALDLIPGYGRLQGIVFRRVTRGSRDERLKLRSPPRSRIRHA